MSDPLERALEKLAAAELPPALMARLTAARPQAPAPRPRWWRQWLLPLATGACAAAGALAWLNTSEPGTPAPRRAPLASLPFERSDFLTGTREMGVVVGPNQRPYRVVEVEWLEEDIIHASDREPGIRMETKRRGVIPVAMEIF